MVKNSIIAGIWLLMLTAGHCYGGAILTISDKSQVDFGEFAANQPRQTALNLTNTGDAPLKIIKISAGCECLSISLDRHDAPPGGKITMQIKLLPGTVSGRFQKKIFIQSNATPALTEIELSGIASPLITIQPDTAIYAGHIPADKTWTAVRQLQTGSDQVKLGEPKLKSDYPATINLEQKNDRQWQLTISVTGKTIGRELHGEIIIPILEPADWAPLRIEYAGYLGMKLTACPVQLFIPSDPQVLFVRSFELVLQGDAIIDATKLVFPALPHTTFKVIKAAGQEVTVEMRREADTEARKYQVSTLTIDYPGASSAAIKITQAKFLNPRIKSP